MTRIAIFGLALAVTVGCQSSRRRDSGPQPGGYVPPRPPVPVAQGFGPPPGAIMQPPPGAAPTFGPPAGAAAPFPTVPQGPGPAPTFGPPAGGNPSFPTVPQAVPPGPGAATPFGPPGGANTPIPPVPTAPPTTGKIEANWQPVEGRSPIPQTAPGGRVLLGPPEPATGEPPVKDSKKLYPPQVDAVPGDQSKFPATSLPVGIAQFAQVNAKVSAGLRPTLDDGFDWLKTNQYRAVLYLRLPGENDAADRKQADARGLNYLSLEVSPHLVTQETVEEFFKLVRGGQQQPLFVYDRDGALAGGMWYLWFRLVEEAPDDVARIRARSLGMREDREGAHRAMWQTVQKFASEQKTR